jgi:anti-anti-sigma factor
VERPSLAGREQADPSVPVMSGPSASARLAVEHRAQGRRHTLALRGELDLLSSPTLEATLRELCENETSALVLDLSGITFIDAAGLRSVLLANDLCKRHGCSCSVVPAPRHVQTLFEVTGVIDVLPFRPECRPARRGDGEVLRRLWRRPVLTRD